MKKFLILALVLVLTLSMAACGNKNAGTPSGGDSTTTTNSGDSTTPADNGNAAPAGAFQAPSDMMGACNDLNGLYEKALNDAPDTINGKPTMDLQLALLVGTGLLTLNGMQLLDISDADGTFGDPNSQQGSYTKQGSKITVASDYVADASGFGSKEGDHIVLSGEADLAAGTAFTESSTERAGAVISKDRHDYLFKDGAMIAMEQYSHDIDATDRDSKYNSAVFVIIDNNSFQFVVGKAEVGASMPFLTFDATKGTADIKAAMESAGFTIEYFGDITGGTINLK